MSPFSPGLTRNLQVRPPPPKTQQTRTKNTNTPKDQLPRRLPRQTQTNPGRPSPACPTACPRLAGLPGPGRAEGRAAGGAAALGRARGALGQRGGGWGDPMRAAGAVWWGGGVGGVEDGGVEDGGAGGRMGGGGCGVLISMVVRKQNGLEPHPLIHDYQVVTKLSGTRRRGRWGWVGGGGWKAQSSPLGRGKELHPTMAGMSEPLREAFRIYPTPPCAPVFLRRPFLDGKDPLEKQYGLAQIFSALQQT